MLSAGELRAQRLTVLEGPPDSLFVTVTGPASALVIHRTRCEAAVYHVDRPAAPTVRLRICDRDAVAWSAVGVGVQGPWVWDRDAAAIEFPQPGNRIAFPTMSPSGARLIPRSVRPAGVLLEELVSSDKLPHMMTAGRFLLNYAAGRLDTLIRLSMTDAAFLFEAGGSGIVLRQPWSTPDLVAIVDYPVPGTAVVISQVSDSGTVYVKPLSPDGLGAKLSLTPKPLAANDVGRFIAQLRSEGLFRRFVDSLAVEQSVREALFRPAYKPLVADVRTGGNAVWMRLDDAEPAAAPWLLLDLSSRKTCKFQLPADVVLRAVNESSYWTLRKGERSGTSELQRHEVRCHWNNLPAAPYQDMTSLKNLMF